MNNLLESDLDHILEHTADLWTDIRGQRLFVTGGTGFVGCWLLESFAWANSRLNLNARAVVLTRNPAAFEAKAPHLTLNDAIELHVGEITDFVAPAGEFAYVIHAAAEMEARKRKQEALRLYQSIVHGTEHILAFAAAGKVYRFLLVSSGAVYGQPSPVLERIPEDYCGALDPLSIASTYGEGKRVAEHLCAIFAQQEGIFPVIARGFAFFGPNLALHGPYAIGNFLRDALNGGPVRVNGHGLSLRSYLYGADMAIWLWTVLFRGQCCRPYNVGSDQAISIAATAQLVANLCDPVVSVEIAVQPDVRMSVDSYVPSIERIRSELGATQTIGLTEGLRRWIEYVRRQ